MTPARTAELHIATSRIPGYLLQCALAAHRVSTDRLRFQYPSTGAPSLSPRAIYLQSVGIDAMRQMGCEPEELYGLGQPIQAVDVLDQQGRLLFEQGHGVTPRLPSCILVTESFRDYLQRKVGEVPQDEPLSPDGKHTQRWTFRYRGPGMYIRAIAGRLSDPTRGVLAEDRNCWILVAQGPSEVILCYAATKSPLVPSAQWDGEVSGSPREQQRCRDAVEACLRRQARRIDTLGAMLQEQWFAMDAIGCRPCWADGRLLWGECALRLHPSTGYWVSFWAIQANRVAEQLARDGHLSPRFLQALDRSLRRVFWLHLQTMKFYLRPTLFWQLAYRPIAWTWRQSALVRRLGARRLAWL